MEVVLLSRNLDYLNECADLLNKQWKRSTSARIQSLEKSVTQLPDSLLLIEKDKNGRRVIGHSRLTRVLEDPYGCLIGSVVISEEKRRNGYGKYLMQKTEEYARALHFETAYLSTYDQQGFYEHLGYIYCAPVSSISFAWNSRNIITFKDYQNKNLQHSEEKQSCNSISTCHEKLCQTANVSLPSPPPPPPLPQSKKDACVTQGFKSSLDQYWMKKRL